LRSRTYPLTLEETQQYVNARLRVAGSDGRPIFTPETIEAAYTYAHGIPRVINLLCEHALISGYADQRCPIPPETIVDVAQEFELDVILPAAPLVPEGDRKNLHRREMLQDPAILMHRLRRSQ